MLFLPSCGRILGGDCAAESNRDDGKNNKTYTKRHDAAVFGGLSEKMPPRDAVHAVAGVICFHHLFWRGFDIEIEFFFCVYASFVMTGSRVRTASRQASKDGGLRGHHEARTGEAHGTYMRANKRTATRELSRSCKRKRSPGTTPKKGRKRQHQLPKAATIAAPTTTTSTKRMQLSSSEGISTDGKQVRWPCLADTRSRRFILWFVLFCWCACALQYAPENEALSTEFPELKVPIN